MFADISAILRISAMCLAIAGGFSHGDRQCFNARFAGYFAPCGATAHHKCFYGSNHRHTSAVYLGGFSTVYRPRCSAICPGHVAYLHPMLLLLMSAHLFLQYRRYFCYSYRPGFCSTYLRCLSRKSSPEWLTMHGGRRKDRERYSEPLAPQLTSTLP
jgi:hypothetical protein